MFFSAAITGLPPQDGAIAPCPSSQVRPPPPQPPTTVGFPVARIFHTVVPENQHRVWGFRLPGFHTPRALSNCYYTADGMRFIYLIPTPHKEPQRSVFVFFCLFFYRVGGGGINGRSKKWIEVEAIKRVWRNARVSIFWWLINVLE